MDKYKLLSKNSSMLVGESEKGNTGALANYVTNEQDFVKFTEDTKASLLQKINPIKKKIVPTTQIESVYVTYKPKQENDAENKNTKIIAISENQVDPFMQSKFKHRKMKKENDDIPVPVLSSPKKKLTTDDHKKWVIPPCLSNWKNSKGYTLPLHMRLTADLRGSKNIELSEKFAQFNDVFNLTEKQIRQDLQERNKLRDAIKIADQLKKENELIELSKELNHQKNRYNINSETSSVNYSNLDNQSERNLSIKSDCDSKYLQNKRFSGFDSSVAGDSSYKYSELSNKKFDKLSESNVNNDINSLDLRLLETRNKIREINEKKLINQQKSRYEENKDVKPNLTNEDLMDSRLYNKTSGLESGLGNDEDYNLYDKPLFNKKPNIYNIKPSLKKEGIDDNKLKDSERILEKIKMRGELFKGVENALSSRVGRNDRIDFHKEQK